MSRSENTFSLSSNDIYDIRGRLGSQNQGITQDGLELLALKTEAASFLEFISSLRAILNQDDIPEDIEQLFDVDALDDLFLDDEDYFVSRFVLVGILTIATRYPEVKEELKNRKELVLSLCGLEIMPEWVRYCAGLEELYIEDNDLKRIPDWISELRYLRECYFDGNQVSVLPESLKTLQFLEVLGVSGNDLTKLECAGLLDLISEF